MNRAFLYGDGFFESFKVINGVPVFWKYHWARILKTTMYLGLENSLSETDLKLKIRSQIETSGLENGRLRVTFYRKGLGKYLPEINDYELDFQISSGLSSRFEHITLNKLFFSSITLPSHEMGNYKLIAKPLQIKAAQEAAENNAEESVLLNDKGFVCEGISGNIFIVKNNVFYTPPLSSGCLAGTLRKLVIDQHKEVIVCDLTKQDLLDADAVIFTNAVKGAMVHHLDNHWQGHEPLLEWLNLEMISSIQDFVEIQP